MALNIDVNYLLVLLTDISTSIKQPNNSALRQNKDLFYFERRSLSQRQFIYIYLQNVSIEAAAKKSFIWRDFYIVFVQSLTLNI